MLLYAMRRLLATIPVMLVVALVVFALLRLTPGDPALVIAGDLASEEDVAEIRSRLGLDRPLHVQFVTWIGQLAQADLGVSVFSNMPVSTLIVQRLEPTVSLAVLTMVLSIMIAVPLGILAAWKAGGAVDRLLMMGATFSLSMPTFLIGYLLAMLFSRELRWLPVQGYRSIGEGIGPFLSHLAMPAMTLGLVYVALLARMTRATMIEVLNEDYIRTAHAKGLKSVRILFRHALKNAAVPVVTTAGLGVALLIGGVIVTESVFAIPGLGRLTVDAVLRRDYPVIQGVILVFSAAYLVINLLVDLSYSLFDPRVRY
ncbi:MAG: ABC transporter permease [Mesorhizobium sp.]|uniref:ABC transporter permease n=1 Tax=Mesorhizobium sp. TaxID=1871066 RepID=UPI000FE7EB59|nr:ABC transporter permease [Mesorhizobium sp.]RWI54721.1 MAG: ABC transporter permease [Mesorhizobium sp.]